MSRRLESWKDAGFDCARRTPQRDEGWVLDTSAELHCMQQQRPTLKDKLTIRLIATFNFLCRLLGQDGRTRAPPPVDVPGDETSPMMPCGALHLQDSVASGEMKVKPAVMTGGESFDQLRLLLRV
ncbi:hypothetical protein Ae201684P_003744 [Aphanomyces euteiches]|nr:hypothetical protein Ae201684P_003744 [Aphanomyces euteiches]